MLTEDNKEVMRNMISHHCEGLGRIINTMNKEDAIDLIKDIVNNSEDNIYLNGLKEALKVVLEDNSNNNNQVLCHECKYYKKVAGRPGTYMYMCTYWNALTTSNEYCSHAVVKEIKVSVEEAINLLNSKRNCNDCKAHFDSNCADCGLDVYSSEEQDKLTKAYDMAIESLELRNRIINVLDMQINAYENGDGYKDEKCCNVLKNLKRFIIEQYMKEG